MEVLAASSASQAPRLPALLVNMGLVSILTLLLGLLSLPALVLLFGDAPEQRVREMASSAFESDEASARFAARTIMDSASAVCGPGCFLGHIGGDDFAVIVPSARAESVAARIGQSFDLGILDLYDGRDREAGYLVSLGRKGEEQKFPLMHISMGGVHLGSHNFRHYLEVANMCAEVKKQAKLKPGSCVFFDRRKDM